MSKILCVLDGFGLAPKSANNAAALAKMPNFKYLLKNYFWTTLNADGENVGQEAGLVGNSEVGHMNIGGLKLVPQLSYQVTKSATNAFDLDKNITPDQFFDPKEFLKKKFETIKTTMMGAGNPSFTNDDELLENSPFGKRGAATGGGVLREYPNLPQNLELQNKAKELRKSGNLSEVLIWNKLKNKQFHDLDFTRQKIIGNYIVDFYCGKLGLVLEIDGASHELKGIYDEQREAYLKSLGLSVIHFDDIDIKKSLDEKMASLWLYCQKRLSHGGNTPSAALPPLLEKGEFPKTLTPDLEIGELPHTLTANLEMEEFSQSVASSKTVHLVGLFSTGQIHSDLRHWAGAIEAAGLAGAEQIVLHLISDGRDSDRQSLVATWEYFIKEFEAKIKPFEDKIFLGSLGGRFYAMDRDNNWERVARGLLPMIESEASSEPKDEFKSLKDFILKKYNVDLNKILEAEKQKWEKDNKKCQTEEEFQEFGYKNHYIDIEQHLIFSKPEHQERVLKGKLETDLKWLIESQCNQWYAKQSYDELLLPASFYYIPLDANGDPFQTRPFNAISKNDTVWLLNFRTDRMKEMSQMLCDINQELELGLDILGMNDYCIGHEIYLDENLAVTREKTQSGYYPIFKNQPVVGTLAEYISNQNQTQLHIAETEKYNHVTYFMNGGQDKKWAGEDWKVLDSNKVASHAEKPEMKAEEVTDYILESGLGKYDYIIVNYANPDMVGHTGDIDAATQTMAFVDLQLGRLIKACEAGGHDLIITADHGNVEKVGEYTENDKKLIDTEHNPNFVPMIVLSEKTKTRSENFTTEILQKAEKLLESNISKPNIKALKQVFSQTNQVDLDDQTWLELSQIPEPILPLWYVGLVLWLV